MPGQPTKIGKYDVVREIGRGGMGKVYAAVDPTIGRLVAIKQVTAVVSDDPDLLKRFYREAQSTGKLQHPNIVTVYDLGEQDGVPYLVMEYLEGDSLEKIIRERRSITVAEKLKIIVQVCEGLAYAHQRQIIHRDIKPGNIVVLNDGSVKIVDFGIAQLGNERYTRTGQVVGSLYYMSPEQIQDAGIDSRSDIYSTGVVLFEFLSGSLPFQGRDPTSTLAKILNNAPPTLANVVEVYGPELDAVVRRALAKDRNQRYASMEELSFDLRALEEKLSRDLIASFLSAAEGFAQARQWEKGRERLRQVLKVDKQHRRANELLRAVQAEIQRQEISEQVRQLRLRAEQNLAVRNWDEALVALDQAVRIDGSDSELIEFRDSVRRSSRLLTEALRRAESAHSAGDLETAKHAVEEALKVDPNNTTAKALNAILAKELSERSKRKKIDEFVAGARKEIALRHFTGALELLRGAEAIDASIGEVQQLIRSASAGLENEKRRQALEKACSDVEDLLNRDEYSAACARADEALQSFPQDLGLLKLKGFAEKQREAWGRRQFIESQSATARQLANSGELVQAQQILNDAIDRYPDDSNLISLLETVTDRIAHEAEQRRKAERQANERRRYIRLQLEAVAELQQANQIAEALNKVRAGLAHYPDSEELRNRGADLEALLVLEETQRKRTEEQARQKKAEIEKTIAQSWQLLSSKQTGEAVALLGRAFQEHPESTDLKSQLEFAQRRLAVARAERERAEQEARRVAEIQQAGARAKLLLDSRQTEQAVSALEQALGRYSESEELKSLLQVAHQHLARERAEREAAETESLRRNAEIQNEVAVARQLLDSGRTSETAARLQQALDRYPDSDPLKLLLRQALEKLAAEEAAREKARQDERRKRAWIEAEISITQQWLDVNQPERAVSSLQQALRQYPDNDELKKQLEFAKARITEEKIQRAKAEREAQQRQDEIDREMAIGWDLLNAGKTDHAVVRLEKAVSRFPDSKQLRSQFDLAKNRFEEEEAERQRVAEEERRKLADIEREVVSARQWMELNQSNRAVSALELVLQRYPDSADVKAQLEQARQSLAAEKERFAQEARRRQEEIHQAISSATQLLNSGQLAQAVASLEASLRRLPDSDEIRFRLEQARDRAAEEAAAKQRAEKEKRLHEAEIATAVASAKQQLDSKQTTRAIAILEKALRIHPESEDLKVQLRSAERRLAEERAERERAEQESRRRLAEIDQEIATGRQLLESKQAVKAVAALEAAARRFSDSRELNSALQAARQRLVAEREAELRVEEERKRRQVEIAAQITAARACLESQQMAKAVAALQVATKNFPESQDLGSLLATARELLAQQRAAEEKAEREAEARRREIASTVENAKRLLKANQTLKALTAIEEALARYPESEELRLQLSAAKTRHGREIAEREAAEKRQQQLLAEQAKVRTLLETGDAEKALSSAEAALRNLGKDEPLQEVALRAKAAIKQRKAEEKRLAAERQRAEEQRRQRERDLSDLRMLAGPLPSGTKQSAIEKSMRKARGIADRYHTDAEIQKSLTEATDVLETALAEVQKDVRQTSEPVRAPTATQPPRSSQVAETDAVSAPIRPVPDRKGPGILFSGVHPKVLNKWTVVAVFVLIALGISLKYFLSKGSSNPASYSVAIETDPIGATVQVGKQSCVTPNCRLSLPAGKYELTANLQGYTLQRHSLVVDAGQPASPVKLVLAQSPIPKTAGYLIVNAGIEGADVLINGSVYSQTADGGKLRLPLEPGEYTVDVRKNGYGPAKPVHVQISTGKDKSAEFRLQVLATAAKLVIANAIPNAEVLADGHYLGLIDNNGGFSQPLDPGDREIVLEKEGRKSIAIRKSFAAGQSISVDGRQFIISPAPPSMASVVVNNLPPGATVKVDGTSYRSDASGIARFDTRVGDHTVEISADGFETEPIRKSFTTGQFTIDGSLKRVDIEGPEWAKVESTSDMAALQTFLSRFPEGTHTSQAQSKLEKLIAASQSEQELKAFYEKFPSTTGGDGAKRRADSLAATSRIKEQDRQAVMGLLQRYQSAYQQLDLKALTDLYPDLSVAARKATQTKFKNAVSVKVTLNPDTPNINGDQASIKVTQTLNWTLKDGSQSSESTPQLTWQLSKKDGRWLIQKGP